MNQELFKEMYDDIQLDREQKNRIWNNLETAKEKGYTRAGKRFHTPAFASICVCIILLIGVPALAANTSVIQSLRNAFNILSPTESNLTEAQKEAYEKYGHELKNEIELPNSTLKLEAIISDEHTICIPFSMKIKRGKLTDTVYNGIMQEGKFSSVLSSQIHDLEFYFKGDQYNVGSRITALDGKRPKDGVMTGCYLLYAERTIKQGDVLQIKSYKKLEETERNTNKSYSEILSLVPVIDEITIPAPAKGRNISVKTIQKKLPEGLSINKIWLSPLSLTIEGIEKADNADRMDHSTFLLELKDGSVVKEASTSVGGGYYLGEGNSYYSLKRTFEAPVNLDDVAGIRLENDSLNLWIPVAD